ncbi:MAG: alpha/beta hydrolase [Granulosicoccus sp.]
MKRSNKMLTALSLAASITLAYMPAAAVGDSDVPEVQHLKIDSYSMPYIDIGEGEPVLFVHGAVADLRTWASYLKPISQNHRYISYTRRWYGEQDWPDEKPVYSHDQHASDMARLIEALDAGPVHLVTWSSGAISSTILAAERPELVKSIVHYEPVLDGVMEGVPGAGELKEKWNAQWGPVDEAAKAGDSDTAGRKLIELVFEMPEGGFDSTPKANQKIVLDNARTIALLFFSNDTKTHPDCEYLRKIQAPTKVLLGAETNEWWTLMSKTINSCLPNSSLHKIDSVNHNGPLFAIDKIVSLINQHVSTVQ